MTPKERRKRLFKKDRPLIRRLEFYDGNEYSKDIKVLWVAHSKEPFYQFPEGITQEQFVAYLSDIAAHSEVLVIDDHSKSYKDGYGPICFVTIAGDGWKVEPHAVAFSWATAKNKLRAAVSFFQMIRYKKIGACVVYSLEGSRSLFDKTQEYGVLHYVGKIPNGDVRGDEYLYTIRGKK